MGSSSHKVYLIISEKRGFYKTYVGYTKNIEDRLNQHNSNKGAKSTKGRHWKLVYKKNFRDKSSALKYEYFLKKNRKLRNDLKLKFIRNYG